MTQDKIQAKEIISIFQKSVSDWHISNQEAKNPFSEGSISHLLYKKNQIDTIQWHVEDEIRRPDLPAEELVRLKRKIDSLNQERTDCVEKLDDYFLSLYKGVEKKPGARMNSETPAWLADRMSILELKIYHMIEQTERKDVSTEHKSQCQKKLEVLQEQRVDMDRCFNELIDDLQNGTKFMKVYRQMKMYNDPRLNPSLYSQDKK